MKTVRFAMDDTHTDYRETHPSVSWYAGIIAIAITVAITFLAFTGALSAEFVLWLDAALIASAVIGLVAWIVASIARY